MSRRDREEKLLEDLLVKYQSLGVVVWGQIEGAPGTYAKILVKSDGTVKVEGVVTLSGSVDVSDRWARQLGQVDIARVLGYTIGVGNPLPTEIIYGLAVIDPRAIRYLNATFDFVSAYVYGSQSMLLQQRSTTYDLLVQLRSGGTEIDPRQIRALTSSDVVSALAYGSQMQLLQQEASTKYLQTIPYGVAIGVAQPLQLRAATYDLIVQLRSAGIEIDPRDVSDRATRLLGRVYGSQGQQLRQKATSPYALITSPEQTRTYVDFSITTSGEIIAAPGVGYKLRLFDIAWSSNAAIVTSLRSGPGGGDMWTLQAAGIMSKNLVGRERDLGENSSLYGYLSGTGTMKGTIGYEVVPV